MTLQVDQNSSDLQALTRTVAEQGTTLGQRMAGFGQRMDGLTTGMATLGRAVTVGAATIAITLAVFMIGTIDSLIAAGAFS